VQTKGSAWRNSAYLVVDFSALSARLGFGIKVRESELGFKIRVRGERCRYDRVVSQELRLELNGEGQDCKSGVGSSCLRSKVRVYDVRSVKGQELSVVERA